MSIIQGLIASISKAASGGGGGGNPALNPVDSNYSLGPSWTIELIGDFYPTQFWATMWGNEVWNSGLGHLAFLSSTTYLNVGAPNSYNSYNLAQDVSVKSYWVFTHTDGSGIDVYRNGQLLVPDSIGYSQPVQAWNTLIYGARHGNDGNGQTDAINNGTFYYYNVQSQAQDANWISANYDNLKGAYGLP